MKKYIFLAFALSIFASVYAEEVKKLPENLLKIMQQPKYQHANWGVFVKDENRSLYDFNSQKLFLPGSITKLFSVAALLHAYGDDYRFKTPVYMKGDLENGILKGDLILVGQGDLTLGGRQNGTDTIAFTKMDHIYANDIPGAILTAEDPLHGLRELAKKVKEKGIKHIDGNVLVDDRLFEKTEKRGFILTPIMINENLIDIVINPTVPDQMAALSWRPMIPGYQVINKVRTTGKETSLQIQISSDELGRTITVEGTIPTDQKDILRVFQIKDPNHFARAAFIQELHNQGITIRLKDSSLPSQDTYREMQPIALWTSPSLTEYAKLILKVSHNVGADLIALLLAIHEGGKTFDKGMLLLGKYLQEVVGISSTDFVFVDAAGGDGNRVTPQATLKLLNHIHHLPTSSFQKFQQALPILGMDGSLADFGKNTDAIGKVFAKTGTGLSVNLAVNHFFLTTQALAGYITGKNGHLIEFMIVVNNAQTPDMKDVFSVFEDQAQMSAVLFDEIE